MSDGHMPTELVYNERGEPVCTCTLGEVCRACQAKHVQAYMVVGSGGTVHHVCFDPDLAHSQARLLRAVVVGPLPVAADYRHLDQGEMP